LVRPEAYRESTAWIATLCGTLKVFGMICVMRLAAWPACRLAGCYLAALPLGRQPPGRLAAWPPGRLAVGRVF